MIDDPEIDLTLENKFSERIETSYYKVFDNRKNYVDTLSFQLTRIPWKGQLYELKVVREYGDELSDNLDSIIRTSFDDSLMIMKEKEQTRHFLDMYIADEIGADPFSSINTCIACGKKTIDTIKNRYRYRACFEHNPNKIPWETRGELEFW